MSESLRLIRAYRIIMSGLFLAFSSSAYITGSVPGPLLERIILNGDSVIYFNNYAGPAKPSGGNVLVLSKKMNNILFELRNEDASVYQYYLRGSDRAWSDWREVNYKEYTNLPAGRYRLLARIRYPDNRIEEAGLVSMKILPSWHSSLPFLLGISILVLLIVWTLYDQLVLRFAKKQYLLEQIINARTEELIIEKEKTESLLANLLPRKTAAELMAKGKATKIKYNFVTVLFSDIQGFTKIAEEMNPEVLIDELDKFFFNFDSVVEKLGIEKIKTIGDAYMCAGGIPQKNRTNPVEVILAALEMRSYMDRIKDGSDIEGMKFWDIRIGIHTGTVVAGVVGHKKLSYDIWGDTVNTASRMESSGEAGKINISGTTYEFAKDFFSCKYRGKMPVKYKGELEMYFVENIKPELCDEDGGPNRKFIVMMQRLKLEDIEELAAEMFETESSKKLHFHNSSFLINICNQVDLLSRAENIEDEEFINMKLAAIFLLTGYITDYSKPMDDSIRTVEEILPRHGFNQDNIDITKQLIRNSYSGSHETIADKIIHDSLYEYMGRVDYPILTGQLRKEMAENGIEHSDTEWINIQTKMLHDHLFLTETARILRNSDIETQISALKPDVR